MAKPKKAFLDAHEFVMKNGQFLATDMLSMTLDRLRSVPTKRVANAMRSVLNQGLKPEEKVKAIIELLDEEGIQPAPEPQPLPAVSKSEVRLVAWMAVAHKN